MQDSFQFIKEKCGRIKRIKVEQSIFICTFQFNSLRDSDIILDIYISS